jgi:hypothetical protein
MTHPDDASTDNGRFASDRLNSFSGGHGCSPTITKAEERGAAPTLASCGMALAQ